MIYLVRLSGMGLNVVEPANESMTMIKQQENRWNWIKPIDSDQTRMI